MTSPNRTEAQVTYRILILGASYGSLFGTKLLMAGQNVSLVCTRATADLIEREGTRVRFPVKGREAPIEVASRTLPGAPSALTPDEADPRAYDLVVLGMQEAHYASPGFRALTRRTHPARKPSLATMDIPPLPYRTRVPRPA